MIIPKQFQHVPINIHLNNCKKAKRCLPNKKRISHTIHSFSTFNEVFNNANILVKQIVLGN